MFSNLVFLWRACAALGLGAGAPYERAMRELDLRPQHMIGNLRIPREEDQIAMLECKIVFDHMEEMARIYRRMIERGEGPPR